MLGIPSGGSNQKYCYLLKSERCASACSSYQVCLLDLGCLGSTCDLYDSYQLSLAIVQTFNGFIAVKVQLVLED